MGSRNEYLTQKVDWLRAEHKRVQDKIKKIKSSEKWRNRNKCGMSDCFYKKQIRLLRYRAPSVDF